MTANFLIYRSVVKIIKMLTRKHFSISFIRIDKFLLDNCPQTFQHSFPVMCIKIALYILYNRYKGVCHEIFDLYFFPWFEPIWAPDKQGKVFSNLVSFSVRYSIAKFEKFDSAVWVKILGLANQKICLQIFSFMIQ